LLATDPGRANPEQAIRPIGHSRQFVHATICTNDIKRSDRKGLFT
jgi:hypothetical protein